VEKEEEDDEDEEECEECKLAAGTAVAFTLCEELKIKEVGSRRKRQGTFR